MGLMPPRGVEGSESITSMHSGYMLIALSVSC